MLKKENGLSDAKVGFAKKTKSYTLNEKGELLGKNGIQVHSKTVWKGNGKERIDIENPNPGKRAGQIHYQDNNGNKFYYDPISKTFPDAPKSVNKKLENKEFFEAIEKGMNKYLGEKNVNE
ncbi:hypothetical protein [Conservatibacter flavescens]|uniref:Uncharacterized protein n=1 Tax=Conservatibacter flavescens TaxID=28161 RepID=A0A2M8S493_9PAST|nr:hypothetical protein [Conservatibacter flavescens]PJG85961.1 hypothetical protein CVP05_03595 [Conservatibacter flavescens]